MRQLGEGLGVDCTTCDVCQHVVLGVDLVGEGLVAELAAEGLLLLLLLLLLLDHGVCKLVGLQIARGGKALVAQAALVGFVLL